jgi:hypothetical protein
MIILIMVLQREDGLTSIKPKRVVAVFVTKE